jgi:hypothetical protein
MQLKHILGILDERPDVYLDELRQELLDTCGVSVSESTVWRTLIKGGYSMKKVCIMWQRTDPFNRVHSCLQPNYVTDRLVPLILPPSICEFLADSLGISSVHLPHLWELFKEEIWGSNPDQLSVVGEECFVARVEKRFE